MQAGTPSVFVLLRLAEVLGYPNTNTHTIEAGAPTASFAPTAKMLLLPLDVRNENQQN